MRIFLLCLLGFFVFNANHAQIFHAISWVNFSLYEDSPFHENPYVKKTIDAFPLKENYNTVQEMNFDEIWDAIPGIYSIDNLVVSSSDEPARSESFYTDFKVCYDEENLYIMLIMVDKNHVFDQGSSIVEIMYQTLYKDRYEEGFLQAVSVEDRNQQYGRFIELGGNLLRIGETGVIDNYSTSGQDGRWSESFQDTDIDLLWMNDPSETGKNKIVIALNYRKQMKYMINPWGSFTDENYDYFSPDPGDTISFDLLRRGSIDTEWSRYCWNSQNNDVYALNYFAGYLHFDDDGLPGLKPLGKDAFPICINAAETPVSVEGENIRWYSDTIAEIYTTEAPVPPTDFPDTITYIYTTTENDVESEYKFIKAVIYNIDLIVQDTINISCGESTVAIADVDDNFQFEPVSYHWNFQVNNWYTKSINFTTQDEDFMWVTAETPSGCFDTIVVWVKTNPPAVKNNIVKADAVDGKMRIYFENPETDALDKVNLYRQEQDAPVWKNIFQYDYNSPVEYVIDEEYPDLNKPVSYFLQTRDVCDNYFKSEVHIPLQLHQEKISETLVKISWEPYVGREVRQYFLYKGYTNNPTQSVGVISSDSLCFTDQIDQLDPLYYRLEASFDNVYDGAGYNLVKSLVLSVPPLSPPNQDTIIVYDTITVYRSVTDTLIIDVQFTDIENIIPGRILVYPNPTNELITIKTEGYELSSDYRVRIINDLGVIIFETWLEDDSYTIDLDVFATRGLFFLQLYDPEGRLIDIRKIILE